MCLDLLTALVCISLFAFVKAMSGGKAAADLAKPSGAASDGEKTIFSGSEESKSSESPTRILGQPTPPRAPKVKKSGRSRTRSPIQRREHDRDRRHRSRHRRRHHSSPKDVGKRKASNSDSGAKHAKPSGLQKGQSDVLLEDGISLTQVPYPEPPPGETLECKLCSKRYFKNQFALSQHWWSCHPKSEESIRRSLWFYPKDAKPRSASEGSHKRQEDKTAAHAFRTRSLPARLGHRDGADKKGADATEKDRFDMVKQLLSTTNRILGEKAD